MNATPNSIYIEAYLDSLNAVVTVDAGRVSASGGDGVTMRGE